MANYVLIYHGGKMPVTDDDKQKSMAAWQTWMQQCGENLVDAGNPFSVSKHVDSNGESEVPGDKGNGYSIVKAPSLADAVKAAQMVPIVAEGGSVDVYETFDVM
jgi:hypothetical protein